MSDPYGIKHAVKLPVRHKLGEKAPEMYGLIVSTHKNGTVDVVMVEPVKAGTKFYDEVSKDDKDCDNVRLDGCPPPFTAVCEESDRLIRKDGGGAFKGQCFAVADMSRVYNKPKNHLTPVDEKDEVLQETFDRVLCHLRTSKLERDGSGELRRDSLMHQKEAQARRHTLSSGLGRADSLEPEEDLEPVETVRQTSRGLLLEEAGRRLAKQRADVDPAASAPEEKSISSRLADLTANIKPPGHCGHGGLG